MSLPKNYCMSSVSANLLPGEPLANFPDHYAILQLSFSCTVEEVKNAFRRMRAEYFATDVSKYRRAQSAYAVLIDVEAREEYDAIYRVMKGFPPTAPVRGDDEKSDGISSVSTTMSPRNTVVMAAVSRIDAQASVTRNEHLERTSKLETQCHQEEEVNRKADIVGREEQLAREPNWGLKHSRPQYESLVGSRPYFSFIPVATGYDHGNLKSGRPTYVGTIATMSMP